jgi:2-dehydro-3-deoxygalactonokinase
MEIFGLLASGDAFAKGAAYAVLPGTHTKWVRVEAGHVRDFFTSMGGELFDRLVERSLLSSVLGAEQASDRDESFARGVERGAAEGGGLSRLLFGVRAQVLRGALEQRDAASYARGLLIGAEIADALRLYPEVKGQGAIPLLGNAALCSLYERALERFGIRARAVDAHACVASGYRALHAQVLKDGS